MHTAVATMCYGESGEAMKAITRPRLEAYADSMDSPVLVCLDKPKTFADAMMLKMQFMSKLLRSGFWDRVLWVDADILIRDRAPSLFDIVPQGEFGAHDEAAIGGPEDERFRMNHIVQTCQEEGIIVPDTGGRYFNMGLFVAEPIHAGLFAPRKKIVEHSWCEQSLINIRIAQTKTVVHSLPSCFNRFWYWGIKQRRFLESTYMLHFAGPPCERQRLTDMININNQWFPNTRAGK